MARSAVLAGRTLADLVRNVFVVLLMLAIGYLVGFRIHTNVLGLIAGMAVMLLFGFSLTWIFAIIGLSTSNAETAQAASFPILAPLVFASSAFVPVNSMPGWLQAFAKNQPVSIAIDAVRSLVLGGQFAEHRQGGRLARVEHRHHRRLRPARRPPLPPRRLAEVDHVVAEGVELGGGVRREHDHGERLFDERGAVDAGAGAELRAVVDRRVDPLAPVGAPGALHGQRSRRSRCRLRRSGRAWA